MVEMKATYTGEKHCDITHASSGSSIQTDAPKDNQGRGEAFSPTDLLGASLASCILTTMAIHFEKEGVDFKGATARAIKEMVSNPRRIGKLTIEVQMPLGIPKDLRTKIESSALGCPVKYSLHPDIDAPIRFVYPD